MLYVEPAAFKASTSIADSFADADVSAALTAASRAVEKVTQRRFWKDSTPATRTYTATSCRRVNIDDAAQINTVTASGAAITSFVAEPLNAAADGEPYLWLSSTLGVFPTIAGGVTVTGLFGWPAVPEQIPQMVTILASKFLKRSREAPFGVVNAGGIEGIAMQLAREDPDMQVLIKPLMRYSMWVA